MKNNKLTSEQGKKCISLSDFFLSDQIHKRFHLREMKKKACGGVFLEAKIKFRAALHFLILDIQKKRVIFLKVLEIFTPDIT